MGEARGEVVVELAWSDQRELVVEHTGQGILARVHPGLSAEQVRQACVQLGPLGDDVYQAWARTVSL